MNGNHDLAFDRIGLHFIQRYWWDVEIIGQLGRLLALFLTPNPGRAWLRTADDQWIASDEDNLPQLQAWLEAEVAKWHVDDIDDRQNYVRLLDNGWALFMDAERFKACVAEDQDVPDGIYVGFEADWCWNQDADIIFTPHFRVTNRWPASRRWAPEPESDEVPVLLTVEEAAETLWSDYWIKVEDLFRDLLRGPGILPAHIDLGLIEPGQKPQIPTVFFYASPTTRTAHPEEYLREDLSGPMNHLARELLISPDLRSTEITGGVLEGCLAVFNHRRSAANEYSLLVPLAGVPEELIEHKVSFVTGSWQEIDFDATWKIFRTHMEDQTNQIFFNIWFASLDEVVSMCEPLFSLLGQKTIQERVFSLSHLLTGFLAKLQARTAAAARARKRLQRDLENEVRQSKSLAEARFTVREIPGLGMMHNISDGYTRAFEQFDDRIAKAAEEAEELTTKIKETGELLDHVSGLEELRRQRTRERAADREEKRGKLLNQVLALVAVLAAIPLLVGQFDTGVIADALRRFGFGPDFAAHFTHTGIHFSFWTALVAFALTIWAVARTMGRDEDDAVERRGRLAVIDDISRTVFDGYRSYDHPDFDGAIATIINDVGDDPATVRGARELIHRCDLDLARAVADALDQCRAWTDTGDIPADDEAWADHMEARVCRFVLLSDVYDLRPPMLQMPVTLGLYRFSPVFGGLRNSAVSDREFKLVMSRFGYGEDELEAIDQWATSLHRPDLTAGEFLAAYVDRGVDALHEETIA